MLWLLRSLELSRYVCLVELFLIVGRLVYLISGGETYGAYLEEYLVPSNSFRFLYLEFINNNSKFIVFVYFGFFKQY